MLDVGSRRSTPPSMSDPPGWLRALPGFDLFAVEPRTEGWAAFPRGIDDDTEFPGGTWRVSMMLPKDLSLLRLGGIDPLVFLVLLANGVAEVETKLEELVQRCRADGKSWTEVGQALGITKQAAWERFSGED